MLSFTDENDLEVESKISNADIFQVNEAEVTFIDKNANGYIGLKPSGDSLIQNMIDNQLIS